MRLAVLKWIHDRKTRRWRRWPVIGVVRAYAVGYVEGVHHGEGCWLDEFFGAYRPASRRRPSSLDRDGSIPKAYRAGRRAGVELRERRKERLRLVA